MSYPYSQLMESNENMNKNPNYINNMNINKIYNNQNINMSGENNDNNNINIEDDLIQNQNNQNPNLMSSGNNIYPRPFQKLKWRNIMKIDIDLIRNSNDLSLINSNLENIIYSNITEDDIQEVPEDNVIKLIKVLQFLNEYLLDQRQMINNRLISLQQEGEKLAKTNQDLDINLAKQEEHYKKYKQDAKSRIKDINDYKSAINSLLKEGKSILRGKKINITDINMDINKVNSYGYNQNQNFENYNNLKSGYKCQYCTGIIFPSKFELNRHLRDIHQINITEEPVHNIKIQKSNPQPKLTIPIEVNLKPPNNIVNNNGNSNGLLEKQLYDMKLDIQKQMSQFEIYRLENQIKNQKSNNDNGDQYKQLIEKMGNAFNNKLQEAMSSMINNQPQPVQPIIKKQKNKEKLDKLDEEIYLLKKQLDQERNKNSELDTQIMKKKEEIIQLNIQKLSKTDTKIEIKPKKIQLVPAQTTNILYQKNIKRPKRKEKKFRAGDLISDHDDTDKEINKKKTILKKMTEQKELINIIINNHPINPQNILKNIPNNIDIPDDVDLDDFYKRYKARDRRFWDNPKLKNYKREIPIDFDKDYIINNNARIKMNKNIKYHAEIFSNNINDYKIPPFTEIDELVKLDSDDLKETVGILMKKIKDLNNEGEEEKHYESVNKFLDLKKLKKLNNIENNDN